MKEYSLPGSEKISTAAKSNCLSSAFVNSIFALLCVILSIVFWFLCFQSSKSKAAYIHIVFQFILAVLAIVTIVVVKKTEVELKFSQPIGEFMVACKAVVIANFIVWTIVFVSAVGMRALWQNTVFEKRSAMDESQLKDFIGRTNSYQYGLFITLMAELFFFGMMICRI